MTGARILNLVEQSLQSDKFSAPTAALNLYRVLRGRPDVAAEGDAAEKENVITFKRLMRVQKGFNSEHAAQLFDWAGGSNPTTDHERLMKFVMGLGKDLSIAAKQMRVDGTVLSPRVLSLVNNAEDGIGGVMSPDILALHDESPLSLRRVLNNTFDAEEWYQLIFEASGASDIMNNFVGYEQFTVPIILLQVGAAGRSFGLGAGADGQGPFALYGYI